MAIGQLALDMVGGDGAAGSPVAMLGALAAKLLFALGFALVWRWADPNGALPGRWHAVLAVSFGAAAFFSIAAAYYHYGALCCERQATLRYWLIDLLAILAMTWGLAQWRPVRGGPRQVGLASMLLALSLFPVLFRIEGLRENYANLSLQLMPALAPGARASRRTRTRWNSICRPITLGC